MKTPKASQTTISFLMEATGNDVSLGAYEFTVPAGAKVPVTYYHEHFNEAIYGMERIITFYSRGKSNRYYSPRNLFHSPGRYELFGK